MFRLLALTTLLAIPHLAIAETFHLRSGGQVEGRLLNADEQPRRTYRIKLDKGGDVTLEARDVSRVVTPSPEQVLYRETLERMPDTVESHMKMYEFCKKPSLTRERTFHLEQIIRIDPNHEEARRLLKFKKQADGSWAKTEDIKRAAGQVRFKGKWMSKEDAQIAEMKEQREAQQIEWKKKIKRWRGWWSDGRRHNQAVAAFESIDDPLAIAPLVELFWSDGNSTIRETVAEILGRIGTASSARALAKSAMQDETEMRLFAVRQLEKNNLHGIAPTFVSELKSSSNAHVRRAAYALGHLGDDAVVLPLIKALRTKHTKLVGGRGDGRINPNRGGLSVGQTKPKKVTGYRDNREVLDALAKLTEAPHARFRFNQTEWLRWYLRKSTPPDLDLRRDP